MSIITTMILLRSSLRCRFFCSGRRFSAPPPPPPSDEGPPFLLRRRSSLPSPFLGRRFCTSPCSAPPPPPPSDEGPPFLLRRRSSLPSPFLGRRFCTSPCSAPPPPPPPSDDPVAPSLPLPPPPSDAPPSDAPLPTPPPPSSPPVPPDHPLFLLQCLADALKLYEAMHGCQPKTGFPGRKLVCLVVWKRFDLCSKKAGGHDYNRERADLEDRLFHFLNDKEAKVKAKAEAEAKAKAEAAIFCLFGTWNL